jgi:hypothetical protein
MQIGKRNDGWSKGMFWAAMVLVPLSILSSGHGPLARFVTGAASAMLVLGLVHLVRNKGCWTGKSGFEGEQEKETA